MIKLILKNIIIILGPLQCLRPPLHTNDSLLLNKTNNISWGITCYCPLAWSQTVGDLFWLNVLLHLSDCRKQDGSDPRISATLEPQLFQPTLPYSTSPFHKVGGEWGGAEFTLWPFDLIWWTSMWPLFLRSLLGVSAHLVSTPASVWMLSLGVISHDCVRHRLSLSSVSLNFYSCLLLFNL